MGKVKTTWLLPGHSGRACNHEDIYTKQDKKTSKVYSVKLCNPNVNWNEKQLAHRNKFGMINAALSTWIKENRASDSDDFKKVMLQYNRQTKYSTLRGMMYGKGMATIDGSGKVVIDITKGANIAAGTPVTGGGSSSGGGSDIDGDL